MHARGRIGRLVAAASVVVAVALATAGCVAQPALVEPVGSLAPHDLPHDTQAQVKTAVTDAMTASGASGAVVGVWTPWGGSWSAGMGTVEPGGKTLADAHMTFRAGPVTRSMTCDALYRLADAGTVKLDDPVTTYVGGIPQYSDITLQELCDSTSGIGSYGPQLDATVLGNPARQWNARELVGYGFGDVSTRGRPGSSYVNSDAGYLLLGLALEQATHHDASDVLADRVLTPLGLSRTVLPGAASAEPVVGGSVPLHGYVLTDRTKTGAYVCAEPTDITDMSASYEWTNAGAVTDISDLGTYVHAVAKGALVPLKKRLAHTFPLSATSPAWLDTAGGVVQVGPLVGQYGAVAGYLTAAFSDPGSGMTVAVVLNNSTAGPALVLALAQELAAIAAKTPGRGGADAPAVGLPWTAEQQHAAVAKAAVCTTAEK